MQTPALSIGLLRRQEILSAFSPSSLFANSEQGLWADPSDLTTLFQDAAGTTPVTANGDPVGMVLDKRLWGGKTLNNLPSSAPNSFLDEAWIPVGVSSRTDKSFSNDGTSGAGLELSMGFNKLVRVVIEWTKTGSSGFSVRRGSTTAADTIEFASSTDNSGKFETIVQLNSSFDLVYLRLSGVGTVTVSKLTISEIPGNHLTQPTVSARPTYKTDGMLHWLEGDGVDDKLSVTFGDLGSACTVAYVGASGVTIQTDQTISGAYDVPGLDGNLYGLIIIDRGLTTAETQYVTAYLNGKAGL